MAYDDKNARPAMSPGLSAIEALSPRLAAQIDVNRLPSTLSPLEALMAQVQQLQNDAARQNHLSRVPPDCLARSLSRGPPTHGQHNRIQEMIPPQRAPASSQSLATALSREVEEPRFRPKSQHPVVSNSSRPSSRLEHQQGSQLGAAHQSDVSDNEGYRRPETDDEKSPSRHPVPSAVGSPSIGSGRTSRRESLESQNSSLAPTMLPRKQSSGDSYWKSSTLAPPPIPPMSSLRRVGSPALMPEGSDDEGRSSTAGSTFSQARQPSTSSGMSAVISPMAANATRATLRSPSPVSLDRLDATPTSRRNFSRPISKGSAQNADLGSVSDADAEEHPRQLQRNHRPPPLAMTGRHHSENNVNAHRSMTPQMLANPAISPSQLPRGRQVPRNSFIFDPNHAPTTYSPRQPTTPVNEEPEDLSAHDERTHSPGTPGASSVQEQGSQRSPEPHTLKKKPYGSLSPLAERNARARPVSSSQMDSHTNPFKVHNAQENPPTLRPRSRSFATRKVSAPTLTQLTAEQHVEKGIECHEAGSLSKSTYHLRLAAMQNNPTGMLLYALACRHGWGMRPNAKEGVKWLRKAVNSVGLDLNSLVEKGKQPANAVERQAQKAREAQFALAVYELGVSHMNGWGTEQDRSLALRCFEISANWGDIDALAEAGYCYAEGLGCRKNLKKAARLYRLAESKGMSMRDINKEGHRIHKEKYLDSNEKAELAAMLAPKGELPPDSKKARSKSHTRSFFGRKRSH
ncbi:Small subunit processome component [Ascosphaera pollenicola]|nr:Small subunit processome component [Ascosphaera pollenicola]